MAEINEIKDPKEIKGDKEDYDPTKKREIIKTILIIFLAVLLVLTFFSNTIMNKSLSEISTQRVTSGKLTERIRGSGLVESNQSYGVTVDGNKVVDTVMVKSGQEVKKGDVLLTVDTGESEDLTAAEDNLATMELEYQKAMLTPPADYTSENQAIKSAREDLAAAIAKRDNVAANQGNIQAAKDTHKYNQAQLNNYTKLQTKLSAIITAIDTDEYAGAPVEYTGDLIMLKAAYSDAESAYNAACSFLDSLKEADELDAAAIEAAQSDCDAKSAVMASAKEAYDSTKFSLRGEYAYQLIDAEANVDWYTAQVDDYEKGGGSESMTLDELNEDVRSKQRALEELIAALNKTKKENDNQAKIDHLDLESKKKEVEKAKKKVDKLRKENETTEIKSKYSGIVSSINVKAGDTTVPDTELMNIDIAEDGYTVQITVDGEKSKKVKKGTAAEIVNNWSGDLQAVLTDIKNDTTAGSKNRILVFTVTGEVDSGTYLDLSIPCGNGNYDCIVPKSAVHEDSDGKFVLTVVSKSSPLGNRYYAERVPVEVVVSDEQSSAVSGNLNMNEYVITAASKPVKHKDQVRMKDE